MCIRDRYYYICPQKSNFIISIEIASILYIPVNPYNLNSNLIVPYPVFFYGLAFCFPILLANTISTSKPQNDIIVTLIILNLIGQAHTFSRYHQLTELAIRYNVLYQTRSPEPFPLPGYLVFVSQHLEIFFRYALLTNHTICSFCYSYFLLLL